MDKKKNNKRDKFFTSGKIADYLLYKGVTTESNKKSDGEIRNGTAIGQGTNNKGRTDW